MNVELEQLRLLPSIDELLQSTTGQQLMRDYARSLTLRAVRTSLARARGTIREGALCPSYDECWSEKISPICARSSMRLVSLSIPIWADRR